MPHQRIAIIGCAGTGKSTFARKLAGATGLPLHHLDRLFWQPGWVKPDKEAWAKTHLDLIAHEAWIIDGNYTNTQQVRFERANHIIFFDFPTHLALWGIFKRVWQDHGKTRPDMAPGCPERLNLKFLRYIYNFNRDYRPQILADLATLPTHIRVDTVRSYPQANQLLATVTAAN